MALEVTLLCGSMRAHYSQIYTGFYLLERQGMVRLKFRYEGTGLGAIVGGKRLFFDVQDGGGLDQAELSRCQFYFKRSYCTDEVQSSPSGDKVRPLGLNYQVHPDRAHLRAAWSELRVRASVKAKLGGLIRAMRWRSRFLPTVQRMEAPPTANSEPRVVFLTRTWVPNGRYRHGIAPREEISEFRAACIRALRQQFGSRAIAGFVPTPHAVATYPDLIAPCRTDHASYLDLLRQVPIGVATTGLHSSIGWKVGEYVAFSRAVVTENLHAVVPGFQSGRHYLNFSSPQQCAALVGELFDDPQSRQDMMENNARYYAQYLRPDQLVWRALASAVGCERAA